MSTTAWVTADGMVFYSDEGNLGRLVAQKLGNYNISLYAETDKIVGAQEARKADVIRGVAALDARPGSRQYLAWYGGSALARGPCAAQDVPTVAQIALKYERQVAVLNAQIAELTHQLSLAAVVVPDVPSPKPASSKA